MTSDIVLNEATASLAEKVDDVAVSEPQPAGIGNSVTPAAVIAILSTFERLENRGVGAKTSVRCSNQSIVYALR